LSELEDAEDYKAFEATIIADYCAETAVARELVLRLASLLWRLRRATAIETDLFEIQAEALEERRIRILATQTRGSNGAVVASFGGATNPLAFNLAGNGLQGDCCSGSAEMDQPNDVENASNDPHDTTRQLTYSFLRLANLDSGVFERLNRYEAALWRQTIQILFTLHPIKQR
jgi:hypothetical protein